MDLSFVLSFIKDGKRYQRESWKQTSFPFTHIAWKNNCLMCSKDGNDYEPYSLSNDDIQANDWKEVR